MKKLSALIPGCLLGLVLACGGSSKVSPPPPPPAPPAAATGFAYTDPTGSGWRLLQDSASTPARIILDLVGPAGTLSRGVGFNLQAATGVRFGSFTETGFPINDTGVYELLNAGAPAFNYPSEVKLLAGGVKPGNVLTVGIFQKDRRFSAKDSGVPLLQIALELDNAAGLHAGDTVALSVPKARIIPGDIGAPGITGWTSTAELNDAQAKAHTLPIAISVGTLVAH
jgi:hypothetical protein